MASKTLLLAGHRLLIDGKQFIHDEHDQKIYIEITGDVRCAKGKWFILSDDGSKREITDRPIAVLSNPRFFNSEIIAVKED